MQTAFVLLCTIGTTDRRNIAEAPDQTELPFMRLQYGMEEAAKHTLPAGEYVKVQCVSLARAPVLWHGHP